MYIYHHHHILYALVRDYLSFCSFIITDLPFGGSNGQYLVNLNISICFESGQPCDAVISVFEDSLLPKENCNRRRDFLDPGQYNASISNDNMVHIKWRWKKLLKIEYWHAGFSLDTWKTQHGIISSGPLDVHNVKLLMQDLGVAPFVKDPSDRCDWTSSAYSGANADGWSDGKSWLIFTS